jgi:hypothetical protein
MHTLDTGSKLDYRLVRALRQGTDALPGDVAELRGYMRMIGTLLAEKAAELEPSWEQACAAAAEIETLHGLEGAVAERAIGVQASGLDDLRVKLEIWRALIQGLPDEEMASTQNRLVLSIEADIQRLQRGSRRSNS